MNVEIHDCRIFLFKSVKALALLFHVWMFFWIAMSLYNRQGGSEGVLSNSLDALALLAAIDAAVTILFSTSFWGYKISTTLHLYGVGWALFGLHHGRARKQIFVCVICIAAAIMGGKRGNLVAMPLAAIATYVVIYARGGVKAASRVFLTVAGLALVLAAIVISSQYVNRWKSASTSVRERYFRNVDTVMSLASSGRNEETSYGGRLDEALVVKRHFEETPMYFLVGAGFGATAKVRHDDHTIGSKIPGRMHQVHIGWVAYVFRCGLLGLVLYAGFFLRNLHRASRMDIHYMGPVMYYIFVMLVLSFKGNILLEDVSLPIVAALAWTRKPESYLHG